MPELDAVLTELGRQVEFPPTPNLAPAVRRRLGERRSWRRPVALALAVLIVAIGAALAVPQARTAILDWLGLSGVHIVRVEKLPPVPVVGNLDLGRQVTLAEARRRAPWLLVPTDAPDRVYVGTAIPGGKVSLLWGTPASVRLLLTEFRGLAYIEKLIEPDAKVDPVKLGSSGVWLEEPHVFSFLGRDGRIRQSTTRLAGKTLLWQQGDVTLRLEGELSKAEALRIARSAD
ncbi:MAG TPA: hypothetical protein VK488_03565 [Gaiellaceae bacterium]|nr:hypothetical protein [Gaiellaceae bacterium]